jgi:prophage maintenance system killer protein
MSDLTLKRSDKGWIVELPEDFTDTLGVEKGSMAVLYAGDRGRHHSSRFRKAKRPVQAYLGKTQGYIWGDQTRWRLAKLLISHTNPWLGGNKRTATAIVDAFLMLNGYEIVAGTTEIVELVLAIESDRFGIDEIEHWLREKIVKFTG